MFLSLLVPLTTLAQAPSPPSPQYAEEIEVRVIDVDVVVTDRHGNPLTNLTRENFELFEDGRRVDIAYFSRIVDGSITDMPAPSVVTAGPAETAVAPAAQRQPRIPLTWVVFIDHTNLPPQQRNLAMRQLQVFLQRALSRGDRGVIALNDGRSFKIRQGMTDDAKLLMETLAKMEKERVTVSPTKNRATSLLATMRRSEEDMGAVAPNRGFVIDQTEFMAQTTGTEIEHLIEEEASRTKFALNAMTALLDALARVDGRLALVYVGAGFNSLPAANLAEAWKTRYKQYASASFNPQPEKVREPIEREITRLFNNLSAHRVTVYTIHGGEASGAPTGVEDAGMWGNVDDASSTDISQLTEAARAREMAQRTGGLFFKVNANLATQLEAVVRDLDNYYALGYKPVGPPTESRRIKVRVNVDGARVRYRETVRERSRAETAASSVVAAAVQPPPRVAAKVERKEDTVPAAVATAANPLGVSVRAERPQVDGWGRDHLLAFDFSLQLDTLTFVKRNDTQRADFVMHFSLVGKDGSVYPLESREQSLAIPQSELPAGPGHLVSHSWHVDLAPLRIPETIPAKQEGLRLTVSVEDLTSGVRSVVTVPLGKDSTSGR